MAHTAVEGVHEVGLRREVLEADLRLLQLAAGKLNDGDALRRHVDAGDDRLNELLLVVVLVLH